MAATARSAKRRELAEESIQSLGALPEAAYRIIGHASCQIESTDDRFRCRLMSKKTEGAGLIL